MQTWQKFYGVIAPDILKLPEILDSKTLILVGIERVLTRTGQFVCLYFKSQIN